MPVPTPFHPRTSALCTSMRWKDWAGYCAVCSYDTYHEREYFAIRHAAGLIDVTPLFKYDVRGANAAAFLSRVMVRDVTRLKVGQVAYTCWCDDAGKMLDDGTVWRLDDAYYRVTSAEPALHWLHHNVAGFDVSIEDVSGRVAALSLQGPNARAMLAKAAGGSVETLKFFRLSSARIDGFDATITRTGYTGDLGYELWVDNQHALKLWDVLIEAGRPFGLLPAALDAMDMTRVEAGFILNGVDYYPATRCPIEKRKSTPFELDLDWMVHLDRQPFSGQAALRAERQRGPVRRFVCLEIGWDDYQALFAEHGLPPEVSPRAWRTPVPVYADGGVQVGQATSGSWSPTLKKNLALATVRAPFAEPGTVLRFEVTVEYARRTVMATVLKKPAFDPPRKKS